VATLKIGVEVGAQLSPLRQYAPDEPPVVVWGSSIAQGGAVTNAGMTWPSNLQRILDRPLLNFGFSGSCLMQLSVASVLASLPVKPAAFVMDCLPNMQQDVPAVVYNATIAVLTQLRHDLGPNVPILVLEGHRCVRRRLCPTLSQSCSLLVYYPSLVGKGTVHCMALYH
jgi:hypothetical protein